MGRRWFKVEGSLGIVDLDKLVSRHPSGGIKEMTGKAQAGTGKIREMTWEVQRRKRNSSSTVKPSSLLGIKCINERHLRAVSNPGPKPKESEQPEVPVLFFCLLVLPIGLQRTMLQTLLWTRLIARKWEGGWGPAGIGMDTLCITVSPRTGAASASFLRGPPEEDLGSAFPRPVLWLCPSSAPVFRWLQLSREMELTDQKSLIRPVECLIDKLSLQNSRESTVTCPS